MKKIKLISLLSLPIIVTPIATTSCATINRQYNFNQSSNYVGDPLPGDDKFDNMNYDNQVKYIQNYNNKVTYVVNDFVCWIKKQIKTYFFTEEDQYIDQYTGSITVNAQSANSNKFNVSLMIDFGQPINIILHDWIYHFENQEAVEGHENWFKIPYVQYFNLTFTQPTLLINEIARENSTNYITYASNDNSQFSLSFKDNKIVPTVYSCSDIVKSIKLNTYTYQYWSFKNK